MNLMEYYDHQNIRQLTFEEFEWRLGIEFPEDLRDWLEETYQQGSWVCYDDPCIDFPFTVLSKGVRFSKEIGARLFPYLLVYRGRKQLIGEN